MVPAGVMVSFGDDNNGQPYTGTTSSFGHENYGIASGDTGVKRKRENDEDIPGVSMRRRGAGPRAATGANAVLPTWTERF